MTVEKDAYGFEDKTTSKSVISIEEQQILRFDGTLRIYPYLVFCTTIFCQSHVFVSVVMQPIRGLSKDFRDFDDDVMICCQNHLNLSIN